MRRLCATHKPKRTKAAGAEKAEKAQRNEGLLPQKAGRRVCATVVWVVYTGQHGLRLVNCSFSLVNCSFSLLVNLVAVSTDMEYRPQCHEVVQRLAQRRLTAIQNLEP